MTFKLEKVVSSNIDIKPSYLAFCCSKPARWPAYSDWLLPSGCPLAMGWAGVGGRALERTNLPESCPAAGVPKQGLFAQVARWAILSQPVFAAGRGYILRRAESEPGCRVAEGKNRYASLFVGFPRFG